MSPWINGEIVVPTEYIGAVIQLVFQNVVCKNLSYIDERALVSFWSAASPIWLIFMIN